MLSGHLLWGTLAIVTGAEGFSALLHPEHGWIGMDITQAFIAIFWSSVKNLFKFINFYAILWYSLLFLL